jgi:hypothetical protein
MNPDFQVTIQQTLPRRVRLSAPLLSYHREACARVASALASEGPFTKVTVRPATGSVIVEGEPGSLAADRLAQRLADLVAAEHDEQGHLLVEPRSELHPGPTRVARAVAHAVASINTDVRGSLDERADLGTILPVIFALGGMAEVAATGKMPVPTWFNLLWWSLRSFMTFNIEAVEEEIHDGDTRQERECMNAL